MSHSTMERTTTGSLLRSTQAWCQQICEKETLDHGIAFHNQRFAPLPEAAQFREVVIDDAERLPEIFELVDRWYRNHGMTCQRWAPAFSQDADAIEPFLSTQGFQPRRAIAMSLTEWVSLNPSSDVRVLPARAMRVAFRETLRHSAAAMDPARLDVYLEAEEERLDDAQWDMFVALVSGQPAGRCALYQVGDLARVMDLDVLPEFADAQVDRALLAHALTLAKRLAMRNVLLQVDEDDPRGVTWFEAAGFESDGDIVEFARDPSHTPTAS